MSSAHQYDIMIATATFSTKGIGMLTVWFIRHGESEGNVGLATSESAMIRLTARGIEQAELIALAFIEPPTLIVTSPYLRAKQTAQLTLLRFPDARREEWPVHEFTENPSAKAPVFSSGE